MANVFFMARINSSKAIQGLEKYKKDVKDRINKATHNGGLLLEGEVKQSIAGRRAEPKSVDTGHFLQTVSTDNTRDFISEVYSNVPYSKYLEFGTSKISPRYHFTNSMLREKNNIIELVRAAVKK